MAEKKHKINIEGGELFLTDSQIETAVSVCDVNAVERVYIVSYDRKKSVPSFFHDERHANACAERHKAEFVVAIRGSELAKYLPKKDSK